MKRGAKICGFNGDGDDGWDGDGEGRPWTPGSDGDFRGTLAGGRWYMLWADSYEDYEWSDAE